AEHRIHRERERVCEAVKNESGVIERNTEGNCHLHAVGLDCAHRRIGFPRVAAVVPRTRLPEFCGGGGTRVSAGDEVVLRRIFFSDVDRGDAEGHELQLH
ncbi:hypothetical protein F2P56_008886, partial [Juglans regia]